MIDRKIYGREYYYKNKDRYAENSKRYKEKNSEKLLIYNKLYKSINKDKIKNTQKLWRIENKDKLIEYDRRQNIKNKNRRREYHLNKKYNLTCDEYDNMLLEQNNRCNICNIHQSEIDRVFTVDHNHFNGKIRSLLCCKCNWLLGNCNESIDVLNNAIKYIIKFNE